jgi:hypothetical protein
MVIGKDHLVKYFMNRLAERILESLSSKSQDKLEKQFNKHFQSVKKSIEIFDYNLTTYKVDQLAKLNDILKKPEINRKFLRSYSNIFTNIFIIRMKKLKIKFRKMFNLATLKLMI